jgi:hypothetical protein
MAAIGASFFSLADLHKGSNPAIGATIELLTQLNPIMEDAVTVECNMGTVHRHSIRTGLPSVAWGKLYQGVAQSKSSKQQVDDTTGFIEGLSSIDKRLLDLATAANQSEAEVRLGEARAYLEAMSQEFATSFFYADTATTPEKFKGLGARYNLSTGPIGNQVVKAGGAGSDNTSIWFVTWSPDHTMLLHPQGTAGGVTREDKGEQRILDGSSNPYYVKEELFTQHTGVAVKDWRYNARVCNIDVSDLRAGTVDIYDYLRTAYYRLQSRRVPGGKQVIYMNRDVLECLDRLGSNSGSSDNFVRLTPMEVEGKEVMSYRGIPIRETDAIVNTETLVS